VLHVIESAYLAEIVERGGATPVPPGQTGELVLTTLGRTGSPLIRYRTGDIVRALPHGACGCGTPDLALEGGILGRTDDMVVVRGVNLYPAAVDEVVRALGGVTEYQVCLRNPGAMAEIGIQIETDPSVADPRAQAQALARELQNTFALRVDVTPAPPGSLPRFEHKARRWRIL
jgi:phenylacetate-CoA ligase